jgi:hypothetical protein
MVCKKREKIKIKKGENNGKSFQTSLSLCT